MHYPCNIWFCGGGCSRQHDVHCQHRGKKPWEDLHFGYHIGARVDRKESIPCLIKLVYPTAVCESDMLRELLQNLTKVHKLIGPLTHML